METPTVDLAETDLAGRGPRPADLRCTANLCLCRATAPPAAAPSAGSATRRARSRM